MFYVNYVCNKKVKKKYFNIEYKAKHFAIDLSYEGLNPLIYENNEIFGRVELVGNCKAFVRC